MEHSNFIHRLNVLLAQRNWSRKRLAGETGINPNTLQGYWTQKRYPKGDDLIRIARSLDTNAEFLVTGELSPVQSDDPITGEILQLLNRFTHEERIEIKGVIRSHMITYFRKSTAYKDPITMVADKTGKTS